jgi:sporulation protein YlmC with PRC-barrel domain
VVSLSQFVTREKVIGMQVVDQRGVVVGTVKDIAFTVGMEKIALVVETKDKKGTHIQWTDVAAVGDLVLLRTHKSEAPPTLTVPSSTLLRNQFQRFVQNATLRIYPMPNSAGNAEQN